MKNRLHYHGYAEVQFANPAKNIIALADKVKNALYVSELNRIRNFKSFSVIPLS